METMINVREWLKSYRHIAIGWVLLILVVGLIGVIGSSIQCSYVESVAANLVADLLVAGLAFLLVDVIFGLTQSHNQRIEAQRKAFSIVGMEVEENRRELELTVGDLQGGLMPPSDRPKLKDEQWNLLVQSPLIAQLPSDLVWTVHMSYYDSQRQVENLRSHRRSQFRDPYNDPETAAELLPQVERALSSVQQAKDMLERAAAEARFPP
jgi:hypothetical protein